MTEVLPKAAPETTDQTQDIDLINEIAGFVNRLHPITDLSRDSYSLEAATTAPTFYQNFGLHADMQIDICETGVWVNLIKPTHGIRRSKERYVASFYFHTDLDGTTPRVTAAEGLVPKKAIFYAHIDDALANNEQLASLAQMFRGAASISNSEKFKQPKQNQDPGTVIEALEQFRVAQAIERAINFGELVRDRKIGEDTQRAKFEFDEPGVYYFDEDTRHPHPRQPEPLEPDPAFFDQYTILVTPGRKIIINKASTGMNTLRIIEPGTILNINTNLGGSPWVSDHSKIASLWVKLIQTEKDALVASTS